MISNNLDYFNACEVQNVSNNIIIFMYVCSSYVTRYNTIFLVVMI